MTRDEMEAECRRLIVELLASGNADRAVRDALLAGLAARAPWLRLACEELE
jgi:hypothetical protein